MFRILITEHLPAIRTMLARQELRVIMAKALVPECVRATLPKLREVPLAASRR
jgi:hypothetical protein